MSPGLQDWCLRKREVEREVASFPGPWSLGMRLRVPSMERGVDKGGIREGKEGREAKKNLN